MFYIGILRELLTTSYYFMNILFVNPYYKPYLGGIERVIEKLSRHFLKQDEVGRVGILSTKWSFPRRYHPDLPSREITESGLMIYRVSSWPGFAPPFYQVPLVWFSPSEIKRVINSFQPDVIQLMGDRWFWGNFWSWFYRGKAKVYFSLSFHELSPGEQVRWPLWLIKQLLRPINAALTRLVDRVQVITEHEQRLVKQTYWTPEHKLTVIPWGVEKRSGEQKEPEGNQADQKEKVTLLSVGRVSKHKGQKWLATVYCELPTKTPSRLVLIGKTDDQLYVREIKEISEKLPKEKEVLIQGEVDDAHLNQWYGQADLFVLFPEYEAFGLVFLEALSHQVPVLTHKVGAIEEVLGEGTILIDQYNWAQAKVTLTKLIEDRSFREKLGREGYRFVKDTYSWEKTGRSFLRSYHLGC